MVRQVMSAALGVVAPRVLEPVPIPRLALGAMNGLAALDTDLQPDLQDGALRLLGAGGVLFVCTSPRPDDVAGWGEAIAQLVNAAWRSSALVRAAGTQGVVAAMLNELTSHLGPYARYAPPAEAEAERARRAGAGGIGATLADRHGEIILATVRPHGPAEIAGALGGDLLLAIDGTSTEGEELSTLRELLAGPEQTSVRLTLRTGTAPPRTLEVVRALIVPPTVFPRRRGDVLELRLTGFAADTDAELAQALADVAGTEDRPRGLVLDLRGNRGGLLREAVAAAEVLLPAGVVATTVGRNPDANQVFTSHGADLSAGLPVVVLVDGTTASAAEVLAAALADQHRAVVAGSFTFGKGLVQAVAPLPDGGALYVSWSRVLAPFGWPLQGLGVMPQVCTSNGPEEAVRELHALDRGHSSLATALAMHRAARAPLPPDQMLGIRAVCPAARAEPGAPDPDWPTAEALLHDRRAYDAALIGPPPILAALPEVPVSSASR
jgi:carboxyl-terminal processing protease